MKSILKNPYALLLLPLLQILLTFVLYSQLPDQMPMQFSFSGEVNSTMPKIIGAWSFPAISLLLAVTNILKSNVKGSAWGFSVFMFAVNTGFLFYILSM